MLRGSLIAVLLAAPRQEPLKPVDDLGIRVAPGFKVTLFSGPEIANDIYSMTLDSKGRVVVTSQGWIKTLHDDDGDGKADRAALFAETRSGGMGMCFDGNDLLFSGDQGFWRYRDADGDGKADGPPEKLGKFVSGEHGHHAMRKGPDGSWYLIGGNDAAITKEHVTLPNSPVQAPETGAIVRYTPDFSKSEVIAHGFRNPYDFDWNGAGDLFTYDSDCERDYFLPWYTPTRIYHVGYGMHHGWRLRGYMRSYARRDYYPDTVPMLWPIGRGSPTGVTVYRHTQFPERYRGGVFALDWTFGRVWFLPLTPEGASYTTKAEVFIEPTGSDGFAPTDVCVAPDGALYVSIGGRRTKGSVFRIEAEGGKASAPAGDLEKVLHAPQPLDAWSRARWEPLARKLGPGPFQAALADEKQSAAARVRAVEVLTEIFEGVPVSAAKSLSAPLRARVAWSLGRRLPKGGAEALLALAKDADPAVQRSALESLADRAREIEGDAIAGLLASFSLAEDARCRQAAARLWVATPAPLQQARAIGVPRTPDDPYPLLTEGLAVLGSGGDRKFVALMGTVALGRTKDPRPRADAVRLIMAALGDTNIDKPAVEVHSNYALAEAPAPEARAEILKAVRSVFPSGDARLDLEAARLLAMLEDEDAESVKKVAAFLTEKSHPTDDAHYLIVLSRLKGAWPEGLAARITHAMLSVGRKLEGHALRTKLTWGPRLGELTALFLKREPAVAEELLKHSAFVDPGHVALAAALEPFEKRRAAQLFLERVRKDVSFPWSEPLLDLLSTLPARDIFPELRAQWGNFGLRDAIALRLAKYPMAEDRDRFMTAIEASNAQVSRIALEALEKLGRDESPGNQAILLRLLRRLALEPVKGELRAQVAALLMASMDFSPSIKEAGTDPAALKRAYQPLFDEFVRRNPDRRRDLEGEGEDPLVLAARLKAVPWEKGDGARGEAVFRARGCQTCHAVQGALGPNLAGAAARFSRDDLFEAISNPNKDVAPLYRTTAFQTKDGQVYTGIVVFESADGYIVQTGATTTARVATADVAAMKPGTASLMPNDLLKGLKAEELADLYAYLRGLGK